MDPMEAIRATCKEHGWAVVYHYTQPKLKDMILETGFRMSTQGQGDGGVGVKNGVNYFGKKNWVGTFSVPFAIVNDLDFLASLPPRACRDGIIEAIKVSLIRDRSFYDYLLANGSALGRLETRPLEMTIRRSAEIFLVQAGCQVVLAEDGFDALSKIADHQPQVIFCDIMMPRLDGYQTCSLIKKNPRFKATPVIMLSSKDGLFDRARGRMVGSDQYLTKPFTKDLTLAGT
jgi:twitching motility two-component system response regulator PilG